MTSGARNLDLPLKWLVDWLHEAGGHTQRHSLALGGAKSVTLRDVPDSIAAYLNEFDSHGGSHWRTFDTDLLRQLAENPVSRDLVLGGAAGGDFASEAEPDLLRIARRLAELGGVILVGQRGSEATADLETTFHVFLCPDDPPAHRKYHMWINPARFTVESLVSVIADSFLDWSCQAGTPAPSHRLGPTTIDRSL